ILSAGSAKSQSDSLAPCQQCTGKSSRLLVWKRMTCISLCRDRDGGYLGARGLGNFSVNTHSIFFGLMTKHHLVQIEPVAIRARFCVMESLSAGRTKSAAPARATPHFMA